MQDSPLLKVEIREQTGSKHAARLRKQGRIPAIIYGHKQKPTAISLNALDFVKELHHGHRLMNVQIGRQPQTQDKAFGGPKEPQKMIVKELQYDYLGKDIIHVDLMRVGVDETVRVTIPIELKGTAHGAHEGGILEEHTDHLEVECKVTDIPEAIVVSVKDIEVGDALHAGDIELPDGVKLISSPEMLLVTCSLVAAAKSTEELEEQVPIAPEVIGEAKETQEESKEAGSVERES